MSENGDKRSVSTDALETLGTIIGEGQGRDAIHLAVDPVVAAVKLYPGQDVGLDSDGKAYPAPMAEIKPLGIVDPFLKAPVQPGQHFWLVVYPRQITSLRHVWSHPGFPEAEVAATQQRNKAASEEWLREFCKNSDCPGYDTVMAAIVGDWPPGGRDSPENRDMREKYDIDEYIRFENDGEYLFFGGMDAHGDIPPEFWDHVEIVTGLKFEQGKRATYFACSC